MIMASSTTPLKPTNPVRTQLPILIALHGLPRSGKSTIARMIQNDLLVNDPTTAPIVSRDAIREALHGQPYVGRAEPHTRAIYKTMIHALFLAGHEVVIADETHYSRAARDFVSDGPWETYWYPVPTPPEVCLERAKATNQLWLLDVIPEMVKRHEPLQPDEELWYPFT